MALQREPFLAVFCTINLSPLLVAKGGFVLIIVLSNYQYSATAFNGQCSGMRSPYPSVNFSLRMSNIGGLVTIRLHVRVGNKTPCLPRLVFHSSRRHITQPFFFGKALGRVKKNKNMFHIRVFQKKEEEGLLIFLFQDGRHSLLKCQISIVFSTAKIHKT